MEIWRYVLWNLNCDLAISKDFFGSLIKICTPKSGNKKNLKRGSDNKMTKFEGTAEVYVGKKSIFPPVSMRKYVLLAILVVLVSPLLHIFYYFPFPFCQIFLFSLFLFNNFTQMISAIILYPPPHTMRGRDWRSIFFSSTYISTLLSKMCPCTVL
jgi:hypothetical protein